MTEARPRSVGVAPGAEGAATHLRRAAAIARRGGVIAFPTETFYGLAADPAREDAVAAIFAVKGRAAGEALPLIAADTDAARGVASRVERRRPARLAAAFWPGPLTLVVPVRAAAVAPGVTAGRERSRSACPATRSRARWPAVAPAGVITATSANRSGSPALATADDGGARARARRRR